MKEFDNIDQDMGAAGLTSSSVEMAHRDLGIELNLDKVPCRGKYEPI